MINDVGKTLVTIRLNDHVINMVNSTITNTSNIMVLDEDGFSQRYTMTFNSDSLGSRCLMCARSFSGDAIDTTLRPVLYIPPNVVDAGNSAVICIPLYECITPSVARLVNGTYQLTWWSNMDEMPLTSETDIRYTYDYTKIHKFNTNSLGDVESTSTSCKILCTAPVHWEKLKLVGYDDRVYNTPLIRDIAVLAAISGEGYVVDFDTGGSSGTKMHSHLNTQDCGFAAAVFMPSATPRVMSWY